METRFKKGHRGYRRDKTAARKTLADEVRDQLEEMVVVIEDGERRKIHNRTALLNGLMADVLHGDARAVDQLMQLTKHVESRRPSTAQREAFEKKKRAAAALLVEFVDKRAFAILSNTTPDDMIEIRDYVKRIIVEGVRNTMIELGDLYNKYTLDDAKSASEVSSSL